MNERQIIKTIAALGASCDDRVLKGIGDDCAVIKNGEGRVWLLTMDTLIESVHFDCGFHPPELLGRKAVSVNVSDVCAMGGRALFALLSLGLPRSFSSDWLLAFLRGMREACADYGCCLIGGDTVASPGGSNFSLTLIGEAEQGQVVYRSTAFVGDTIWVSGQLGFAAAGLALLSKGIGAGEKNFESFRNKHLNPRAQSQLGPALAASGLVHAMMDLSDGLSTDLAHICEQSLVGAELLADSLPGQDTLAFAADLLAVDPLDWILNGGEDYELLFTAAPEHDNALLHIAKQCGQDIFPIGQIVPGGEINLIRNLAGKKPQRQCIGNQGFDHFRNRSA